MKRRMTRDPQHRGRTPPMGKGLVPVWILLQARRIISTVTPMGCQTVKNINISNSQRLHLLMHGSSPPSISRGRWVTVSHPQRLWILKRTIILRALTARPTKLPGLPPRKEHQHVSTPSTNAPRVLNLRYPSPCHLTFPTTKSESIAKIAPINVIVTALGPRKAHSPIRDGQVAVGRRSRR